jgi:hypothetical protein
MGGRSVEGLHLDYWHPSWNKIPRLYYLVFLLLSLSATHNCFANRAQRPFSWYVPGFRLETLSLGPELYWSQSLSCWTRVAERDNCQIH